MALILPNLRELLIMYHVWVLAAQHTIWQNPYETLQHNFRVKKLYFLDSLTYGTGSPECDLSIFAAGATHDIPILGTTQRPDCITVCLKLLLYHMCRYVNDEDHAILCASPHLKYTKSDKICYFTHPVLKTF